MKAHHPGVQPNTVHYSSAISACGTAGRWREAEQAGHPPSLGCPARVHPVPELGRPARAVKGLCVSWLQPWVGTMEARGPAHCMSAARLQHTARQAAGTAGTCAWSGTVLSVLHQQPPAAGSIGPPRQLTLQPAQVWKEMVARSVTDAQCQPNVISYSALMTVYCQVRPGRRHRGLSRALGRRSAPPALHGTVPAIGCRHCGCGPCCWGGRQCCMPHTPSAAHGGPALDFGAPAACRQGSWTRQRTPSSI